MKHIKKAVAVISAVLAVISYSFSVSAADSKAPVDILDMTVAELQQAVDDGYLSYYLITKLYSDRLKAYAGQYGAVITYNEKALEQAVACDEEYKANGRKSGVFGIPIVVKDNIDVYGMPTTAGSGMLEKNFPNANSEVVQKLIDQGAIVLAKTNMSYFAMYAYYSSGTFGSVYNAFNLNYSAYGSSSGSCVAVAAKLAPLALGTDTNASLRNPASANGVVSIRPTYGKLSLNGVIPYDYYRDTVGAIAHNVADCALLLGAEEGDASKYLSSLDGNALSGKVIGVIDELVYSAKSSNLDILRYENEEVKTAFDNALAVMESKGATIVHLSGVIDSNYNYLAKTSLTGWTFEVWFNEYIKGTTGPVRRFKDLADGSSILREYYEGNTMSSIKNGVDKDLAIRDELKEHIDGYFTQYGLDALIYPTMQNTVQLQSNPLGDYFSNAYLIAPVCGYPAMSVPVGTDSKGFPIGIEILGRANNESKLFSIAYSYEQSSGLSLMTKLAPALYEVPNNVKSLIKLYEGGIFERSENNADSKYGVVEEAFGAIKDFFAEYDGINDPDSKASSLSDNYAIAVAEYKQYLSDIAFRKSVTRFIIIAVAVIVLLVVAFIGYSVIRNKNEKKRAAARRRKRY